MYAGAMHLGSLLRRKYVAALKTISSTTEFLTTSSNTVQHIEGFFNDEIEYMGSFEKELPRDIFNINYIGLLEQLEIKEYVHPMIHSSIDHIS